MTERWCPAYVALGSNLEQPREQLKRAHKALAALRGCCYFTAAGIYASKPMGPQDQPNYINSAAALLTRLSPEALLAALQSIENAHGRQREQRWGARTLDLDLLMMPGCTIDSEVLTLPHPGLAQRNFVLQPLAELCGAVSVPGLGSVAQLAAKAGWEGLERIGDMP